MNISPKSVLIVGKCATTLWGIDQLERFRRAFARVGLSDVRYGPNSHEALESAVLVRADVVLEQSLVAGLVNSPNTILAMATDSQNWMALAANVPAAAINAVAGLMSRQSLSAADPIPYGLSKLTPVELASSYNHALRKRAVPYALSLSATSIKDIEWTMFQGSYKGVTDLVTKWIWPRPAFWVTRWCARMGITPNSVTAASLILVLAATILFGDGLYVSGVVAAWGMTFLDTVDGKLARVTLTSSKWGDVFDHGIDLLHPPLWYWAWWLPLAQLDEPMPLQVLTMCLWVIIGGYIAGRLQEGFFLWQFGLEIHAWRPIDSRFRLYTARRNPNLVLLTAGALMNEPALGFLAVAIWTIASLIFHGVRIGQAIVARQMGQSVRSWLTESSPVMK
jgi:phosphatidylglycerophosphate synthase